MWAVSNQATPNFETIEMSDVKVQDLGDVAVVTWKLVEKGRYKTNDLSGTYRFTDVWAKHDGRWQLFAGQETRYPSAASTSTGPSSENAAAVEKGLIQLERTWAKAEEKYDPKVLDEILAKDFVSMNGAGEVKNKAQEITSEAEPPPSDREVVDDMSVHIYGDTAVVVGRFTWTDRTSGSVKLQGRFVDTFIRRDGRWKVVANSYVHTDAGSSVPKHLVGG
jgi:ketosteroid isomerase-like protein